MKRHPSRLSTPSRAWRHASLAPVALALLLVLGACGSDGNADDSPPTADSSSTDGMLAPRPIEIAGGGSPSGGGAATADGRLAAPESDAMWAPYAIYHYVAGEGLTTLPANDVGYVYEIGAAVTSEQVAALAAALGVAGDPVRNEDEYSAWWTVGPQDGTAPALMVYEDAQQSWNYNSAWATATSPSVGCGVAGSDGEIAPEAEAREAEISATIEPGLIDMPASTAPLPVDAPVSIAPCETPAPPQGILTADEAQSRTLELMTAVGLDPAAFALEPYADEWYASVSAVEQLGGFAAGRRVDAGFGENGVLQYASGQLAIPQPVGPFPLIGLEDAIARLNDQNFYGGGYAARGGMEIDVAETVDVISPDIAEAPVSDGAVPPVDTAVPAEPEEVTITLVSVEADIWTVWDVDGTVWLLPAYRFIGADGGWYTVPAVTDEFLVQPPVPEVPETLPAETVPAESVPTPPPTTPPSTIAPDVPTSEPTADLKFDTSQLDSSVGLTYGEFVKVAESLGATVRVAEIAGVGQAVTMDYQSNRVNVAVDAEGDAGIVTAILDVG